MKYFSPHSSRFWIAGAAVILCLTAFYLGTRKHPALPGTTPATAGRPGVGTPSNSSIAPGPALQNTAAKPLGSRGQRMQAVRLCSDDCYEIPHRQHILKQNMGETKQHPHCRDKRYRDRVYQPDKLRSCNLPIPILHLARRP